MPTIPQMIRSGKGEWSSASLCRNSAIGTGKIALYEPLMAAADRLDALEAENKILRDRIKHLTSGELDRSYIDIELGLDIQS